MASGTSMMNMEPTMSGMAAASTSTANPMSGMGMGNGCKISMLWNWNTVDACFISSTWRITSNGMFAGSCIGVILLVMCLEALRRLQREYDAYLVRQYRKRNEPVGTSFHDNEPQINDRSDVEASAKNGGNDVTITSKSSRDSSTSGVLKPQRLRPTVFQQAIRAFIHMLQFAVAYFIMLMAMYYNGYIIMMIIIGSYLGSFFFSWEGIHITDA
ncbi:MAG: hypothetical protein Q9183_002264 [Haloplaca sp. 2 TL-2023]